MILKKLTLKNFRGIKKTTIKFDRQINVIIGVNGSGKTTILDAIALLLNRTLPIFNEKPSFDIRKDIMVKQTSAKIGLEFRSKLYNKTNVSTVLCEGFINKETEYKINFEDSKNKITRAMREGDILDNAPLIAYYPIGRAVLDVSIKADNETTFNQIDAYNNCLTGQSDFKAFFKWYRLIDDIYNADNIDESEKLMREAMLEAEELLHKAIMHKVKEHDNKINELMLIHEIEERSNKIDEFRRELKECIRETNEFKRKSNEFNKKTDKIPPEVKELIREINNGKSQLLEFIEKAILECTGFGSFSLDRAANKLLLKKGDDILDMNMLSHGEKIYIALVGDIARRLTMLNQKLENPLKGDGVILIDEIELHLHPQWQANILGKLQNIFPNCQFIVTTHSPQVLHGIKADQTFILEDFEILKSSEEIYGKTSNQILEYFMGTPKRDPEIQKQIDEIYKLIDDEEYENAKKAFDDLVSKMIEDPEISKLNYILNRFSKVSSTK